MSIERFLQALSTILSERTGQRVEVTASCVCDWKHGRYIPKHDKLLKISKLLQIPVSIFDEVA